jgi:hypothetical protein
MATYGATSPYYATGYSQFFLDVMVDRPIPRLTDDLSFIINQTYQYRPDLLAFDLYQNSNLWWVFYQRNPNSLTAPPLDFVAGKRIFLPKLSTLQETLGF